MKFVHIINPVKVSSSSDLFVAQPIAFESLRRAKDYAKDRVEVNLLTAQYPEDHEIIPNFFTKTSDLTRSILDIGEFTVNRKLPLIKDILDRAVENYVEGDYIIYSNADIAAQPHFYEFIAMQIDLGLDAFVINRRTISSEYDKVKQLPLMYADLGESHPGYDCFVFGREMLAQMQFGNICIGAAYIGLSLYLNLKLFSRAFNEFGNEHLTFHIGNDKQWKRSENDPFRRHNEQEFQKIRDQFSIKFKNVQSIVESAFPNLKVGTVKNEKKRNWIKYLKRSFGG